MAANRQDDKWKNEWPIDQIVLFWVGYVFCIKREDKQKVNVKGLSKLLMLRPFHLFYEKSANQIHLFYEKSANQITEYAESAKRRSRKYESRKKR